MSYFLRDRLILDLTPRIKVKSKQKLRVSAKERMSARLRESVCMRERKRGNKAEMESERSIY